MENDFSAPSFFSRIMRFWWLLIGLMIAGGIAGFLAAYLLHPVYESDAVITSSLDYSMLGKLSDWEEDQTFVAIGDVISSADVLEKVKVQAAMDGIQLTDTEISRNFSTDRQDVRWVMRVRSTSASEAKQLNVYWTSSAMEALTERKKNSETSLVVQQYMNALADCFSQAVVVDPSSASCSVANMDRIRSEMAAAAKIAGNNTFSRTLIISHTSFELTTSPTLPTQPILRVKAFFVLGGAFIGLIVALTLFLIGKPKG